MLDSFLIRHGITLSMDDIVLLKRTEINEFSASLGFTSSLFLDDLELVVEKGDPVAAIEKSKKIVVFRPTTEKMLRLVLERSKVHVILGVENIHPEDSFHYVRGGLDQILCKIAADRGKVIAFSFHDILHAQDRAKLLARMRFNFRLCSKYKVKTLLANFATEKMEMRSKNDLAAWKRIVGKK